MIAALTLALLPLPQIDEPAPRALELPALERASLERWREHVLPDREELGFAQLPWHASFASGLRAAQSEGRALLLWAMNGHPLGCT